MFHSSKLGGFRYGLLPFVDLDGYVPERGDPIDLFRFDKAVKFSKEEWESFVERAVKATEKAIAAREDWLSQRR